MVAVGFTAAGSSREPARRSVEYQSEETTEVARACSSVHSDRLLDHDLLDHIVRRCLAKDPDERWQSAGDLGDELKWIRMTSGNNDDPNSKKRSVFENSPEQGLTAFQTGDIDLAQVVHGSQEIVLHRPLPTSGSGSWKQLIMPAISLGWYFAASHMRLTRSSMLEVLNSDYLRTARSKGVSERLRQLRMGRQRCPRARPRGLRRPHLGTPGVDELPAR